MSNNYLKFILSISFSLNLFLGYYFVYTFFFKKENDKAEYFENLINQKEEKIVELDKVNKKNELLIDSLLNKNDEEVKIVNTLTDKINKNKKDEKTINTPKTRINNADDAALISELSTEEFE
jgi:hypothetical protein